MSRPYNGPKTDHFDGRRFLNPNGENVDKSFMDLLKWRMEDKTPFPDFFESPKVKVENERVTKGYNITFINHATLLIQLEGLNILTDPIWSDRASPLSFLGPRRVTNPGVRFEDLPPIDLVLISHNHYDHMDVKTLNRLHKEHDPQFIMGLGNSYYLEDIKKEAIVEMDWGQTQSIKNLKIHFVPVQHWSRRGAFDTNKALWGGFVLQSETLKIYFAGDTGYSEHFKNTKDKFGAMDVSLLPIGAYAPRWFMKQQHINPEEAVIAHKDLESKLSIGIHFYTFQLTNEGIDEPQKDLAKALKEHNINPDNFIAPKIGQSFTD